MTSVAISFFGIDFQLDPSGAAYLPASRTLVISDLHFEKGSALARKGIMLPPYDTRATLKKIDALIKTYRPDRVIALGDSFHDGGAEGRMHPLDANRLAAMVRDTDWIWILGNHDPEPPDRIGGTATDALTIGDVTFRHEPEDDINPEVCGHFHPCARILAEGRALRRRCFVTGETRMIMPAMGAFTGGLNILDTAVLPLLGPAPCVYAMGRSRVFSIPAGNLLPDAAPKHAPLKNARR